LARSVLFGSDTQTSAVVFQQHCWLAMTLRAVGMFPQGLNAIRAIHAAHA
jgi:hypothetical protein